MSHFVLVMSRWRLVGLYRLIHRLGLPFHAALQTYPQAPVDNYCFRLAGLQSYPQIWPAYC